MKEALKLKDIRIGEKYIGENHKPFIIAEMSGNHNQSLERAFEIVDAAAAAGADAIKLQTYTADTLTIDKSEGDFFIQDKNSLWKGSSLYDLYKLAYTPWEWHKPIMERAKAKGIMCFSSPFDETAVDFLDELGVPCFKIASFENNYFPLIKKVATKNKPVIISTGMSTLTDLQNTVECAREAGIKDLILLKCTSSYPATPRDTNLRTIPHMREMFDVHVGLSDHTMGVGASVAAVALGAGIIEKHFTLNRADGGVDSSFSLEPQELKSLVIETERAWQAMGKVNYTLTESEKKSIQFRRSIYVVEDVKAGELFTEKNIRIIRPGNGMSPLYFERLIGKKSPMDFKRGTPLKLESFLSI